MAETTIEDYKKGIVEYIDKWKLELAHEDKRKDYLYEAISLANRLADFDHKYMGMRLSDLYEQLKGELNND